MRPHIYPVRMLISNAFIVQFEQAAIVVDTGLPGHGPTILDRLALHGLAPQDVKLILLTHGHADHMGSAAELKAATGAPIAIHPADAAQLRAGRNSLLTPACLTARLVHPLVQHRQAPPCEPDILLEEGQRLDQFGMPGRIMHTPGHSAGSVSVLLDGGQTLIGDLLLGGYLGGYLFDRRPGLPYFIDNREQLLASVRRVLAEHLTTVFVGHGGPLKPDAMRRRFEGL